MSERLSGQDEHWALKSSDREVLRGLIDQNGCSEELAQCLASRGLRGGESAQRFLQPSSQDFLDPYGILNMQKAVDRLRQAAQHKERIRVVTDYDVDGTTSSLVLQSTLRFLGVNAISYHIPDRMIEGYGFSVVAAEKAHADGIDLIVTADIGVKDHAAVARAHALGVDVLICDHHLPSGAEVPEHAIVLCPPQAGCLYSNKALAACGVSWKLSEALLADHPKREAILLSLLKLVAIGTVADVVDLSTRENRAIVKRGLEQLNAGRHTPGLQALLEVSGLQPGTITSSDLGFRVGPRINAAGRLASATTVVDLLQCRNPQEAKQKALALDRMNTERRAIQDKILEEAIEQVVEEAPRLVVVSGTESDGWHRGVTGIVAGRLRDHFGCPALVISQTDTDAVGSMRSTPQVHAVELLEEVSETLTRFGGHPAAAGFSLSAGSIPAFRTRLMEAIESGEVSVTPPSRLADLQIQAANVSRDLVSQLAVLEPTGKGNESPLVWIQGIVLEGHRTLKDKHLKAEFPTQEGHAEMIWWNAGHLFAEVCGCEKVDVLGRIGLNRWRGRETLQVQVEALRPA
ncbi:MAG: single-stranded-DNA-specific exonuclease RecJ [Myxococcota bacterium]|nr:single-stranded-DNA-specific exonuclease RecJ [Myxococcota bacterium]